MADQLGLFDQRQAAARAANPLRWWDLWAGDPPTWKWPA